MAPHLIIVGGGFGGLSAARALRGAAVRVTLIDKRNYHLFRPMLYQVATGLLSADEISGPLRSILSRQENIDVLLDEVTGISPKQRIVHLKHRDLAYDFLILATGIRYNYFGHDEWRPFAPGLESLDDADVIRNKILLAFERAEELALTIPQIQGGPCVELERSLPSEVAAISPFVDKLMLLIRKCGCVSEGENDIEIALREALANAIIHGNHEDPRKHIYVRCCCKPDEVSIAVKDEGRGFDINKVTDPTTPENIGSTHGRGIYLMKELMDDVRFEKGGAVVHMRKSVGQAARKDAQKNPLE